MDQARFARGEKVARGLLRPSRNKGTGHGKARLPLLASGLVITGKWACELRHYTEQHSILHFVKTF